MAKYLTMPQMYYYRSGVSDRDWIESRMIEIPKAERQEVADEYERIFMRATGRRNRKGANTYIQEVALKYKRARHGKQQKKV